MKGRARLEIYEALLVCLAYAGWMAGIVISSGFWSAAIATSFPPYALYLVVEKIMIIMVANGWA